MSGLGISDDDDYNVVESDDEDDDIFEPERRFSGVFNIFVNHWCMKKDKNVFELAFRLHASLQTPKMFETRAYKKFNFQHYIETKMSQIIVFWSNHEIKMPRNVVFRLYHKMKIPRNSKIVKKTRQI